MTIRDEVDLYIQEVLKMQYMVSNNISHRLTKGELREKFIRRVVQDEFPNLLLKSGILCEGTWQSTQGDFLWLRDGARIGNLDLYDLKDCLMFMEIKSQATAKELRAINDTAKNLKQRYTGDFPIKVGMFCYGTVANAKTILRKFGFTYDKEIDGYNAYAKSKDVMPNVDFIFSLNIVDDPDELTSAYLVARDFSGNCSLYIDNPVIRYFFNYFR
mgnify:FL=1